MSLKLYGNQESRSVVLQWLFLELGVEYEYVELAYHTQMKAPDYLSINPYGKVPTLVDDNVIIYEMAAICAYLADKFNESGFAPALNDPKRGLYYRWLFTVDLWANASSHHHLGVQIQPEQTMYMEYGDYETAYQALIKGLAEASPYVCGQQFTVADIYLSSFLLFQLKFNQIQPHPQIEKYLKPIREREMLKKSQMSFML